MLAIIKIIFLLYSILFLDASLYYSSVISEGENNSNLSDENKNISSEDNKTTSEDNKTTSGNNKTASGDKNINVGNPTLNLNTPNVTISVPGASAAVSGGLAIKAGMEMSKHVSHIGAKIGIAASTIAIAAAAAKFGNKVGSGLANKANEYIKDSWDGASKFVPNIDLSILFGRVEGLDKYPLNLLTDMFVLNSSAIVLLILIFNVLVSICLKNVDISKFFPKWLSPVNNPIGKFIYFVIMGYINLWYASRVFLLSFSILLILICLLINLLGFIIILNSG